MIKDNMLVWNQVCQTDPDMTDKVAFGAFKFTSIDAMYQIKRATEVFGSCGLGWGVRNQNFEMLTVDPADAHYNLMLYTAQLWYKIDGQEGSLDIAADIELFENTKNGWKRVSDPMKKVRTDALTKGLSWLGFSADVFQGRFDDSKYVNQLKDQKEAQTKQQQEQAQKLLDLKKKIQGRARFLGWPLENLEQFAAMTVNRLPSQLDISTAETLLKEMMSLEEAAK